MEKVFSILGTLAVLISFISCQKSPVCLTDDEIKFCLATNVAMNEIELRQKLSGKWSLMRTQVIYGLDGQSDECGDQNITLTISGNGKFTVEEADQLLETGVIHPLGIAPGNIWLLIVEPPSIYLEGSVLFCQSFAVFQPYIVSDGRINLYRRND